MTKGDVSGDGLLASVYAVMSLTCVIVSAHAVTSLTYRRQRVLTFGAVAVVSHPATVLADDVPRL